jgi:hypothetical protein
MSEPEFSKEEQILKMVKKVLTDVARDTHVKPGLKHPLSDNTIMGIRDCLALISARELELAKAAGRSADMRPRFADEPQTSVVVPISNLKKNKEDE